MDSSVKPWVMVVEDDLELREQVIVPALTQAGFHVAAAGSALEMYRAMLTQQFNFFVVDVGLPDENGFNVVRHLRGVTHAGMILLTGRHAPADKVHGLEMGADAYLTKPVDPAVLVATVRSVARRAFTEPVNTPTVPQLPRVGGWTFDLDRWRLLTPDDSTVKLSIAERELLRILLDASGQVVPRKRIIEGLTAKISDFEEERLEMLVFRLRRKAEAAAAGESLPLRNVRGVGYVLLG
ncbi:response regulator transcription factor [Lysobacter sp. H21R4]|uniref:response regulator transcription factor n=1 Tax=Lysobacter sp. H21R4 TaxID=2781021 RepID=UPI001888D281|nr:response regulator transcription factor [Lysobacter sp. H21R4]QOY62414.1 response regulator transcription factor [Lysobacter sp. H21R4]